MSENRINVAQISGTQNSAGMTGELGAGALVVNDYRISTEPIEGGHRLTVKRGSEVQTIDVKDGVGIANIVKTGSTGDVDSYRINFTDGSTFDYAVETNAAAHAAAEAARVEAEESRVSAEAARVSAEAGRVDAEAARVASEAARESAEAARESAESARAQAEDSRQSTEAARVAAEQSRTSEESVRVAAENARVAAETARANAENERAGAETLRAAAETERANAESGRVSAEQGRVSAESERVAAEEARATEFAGFSGEINELKDDLAKIDSMLSPLYGQDERIGLNKCTIDAMSDGWIAVDGAFTEKIGFRTTDYIDISGFESGYLSAYCCLKSGVPYGNLGMFSCCFFYDTEGNVAPGGNRGGHNALATCAIELPEGAKYARVSFNTADVVNSYMIIDKQVTGKEDAPNYVAYEVIPATDGEKIASENDIFWWKGKTWLSYGDSITAIGNGNPADAWQQYVTDRLKFGAQIVRGIGGSTYKYKVIPAFINADGSFHSRADGASMLEPESYTVPDGTTAHWSYMASWDRITAMIPDDIKDSIDLIFTFGVNDSGWMESDVFEPPVFSASNTTDAFWMTAAENTLGGDYDVNTFIGAWASCVMKLQKRCPNALVVCGTGWSGRGSTDNTDSGDYNVSSQNVWKEGRLVQEIANYFSVPCVDIWGNTQVNPWNRSQYNADVIHPYKDAGKKALARAVIDGLSVIHPKFDIS